MIKKIILKIGKDEKGEQRGGTQININFGSKLHRMGENGKVFHQFLFNI